MCDYLRFYDLLAWLKPKQNFYIAKNMFLLFMNFLFYDCIVSVENEREPLFFFVASQPMHTITHIMHNLSAQTRVLRARDTTLK